jgi:hypothetical protein
VTRPTPTKRVPRYCRERIRHRPGCWQPDMAKSVIRFTDADEANEYSGHGVA